MGWGGTSGSFDRRTASLICRCVRPSATLNTAAGAAWVTMPYVKMSLHSRLSTRVLSPITWVSVWSSCPFYCSTDASLSALEFSI